VPPPLPLHSEHERTGRVCCSCMLSAVVAVTTASELQRLARQDKATITPGWHPVQALDWVRFESWLVLSRWQVLAIPLGNTASIQ
jgi:hypothetical protein